MTNVNASSSAALYPMEAGPVLQGAEPQSWQGTNSFGALVLHGFTGSPQSMRPLASALADAGFSVELPRLPGHGTSVADMQKTLWTDWATCALAAYDELAARVSRVFVCGLSMGGTLTAHVAVHRPAVVGIGLINAAVEPAAESFIAMLQGALDGGVELMPAIGGSIKKEGVTELAYEAAPIAQLLSMMHAGPELDAKLPSISCPAIVLNAPNDPVVPASASDHFCAVTGGPVERVTLANSLHVATLDNDAQLIETSIVEFAQKVCAAA